MLTRTDTRDGGGKSGRAALRRSAEARITEIKAAARRELAEKGYQNFLPSELAQRCGVSEATIYRYFPTKRELLIQVAEDWFSEILAVEPKAIPHTSILAKLRHIIRHCLWTIRSQPALSQFVLQELRPDPTYRSLRIFELNRRFTATVVDLVQEAIANGNFRPGISPTLVRDLIFGGIEHQTWSYLRGEGDFDMDAAADGIASVIVHGMAATPPSNATVLAPVVAQLESNVDSLNQEIRKLRALLAGGSED